jgi:hypothetical protein
MMGQTYNEIISIFHDKSLNGFNIHVDNFSTGRFIEEKNFELFLKDRDGNLSEDPIIEGVFFAGRGEYYRPWLEVIYNNRVRINSNIIDISGEEILDEKLFEYLSDLLPPGSHMMVVYINQEETSKSLELGVPPPATPIGYLMFKTGFTWFKDWYFSEGFWEGDVKLQGDKPLNDEHRKKNLKTIEHQLTQFLEKIDSEDILMKKAKERAEEILRILKEL